MKIVQHALKFSRMKSSKFYLILGVLLGTVYPTNGQEPTNRKIVVIDPGHGGIDSGATAVNGLQEKDVVFKIAMEILRLNRELYNDTLEVYCTRYSDTLISLRDRTKLARSLKPDAFVSIHCNQAVRKTAQGVEVYFDGYDKKSETLARLFSQGLNEKLGFRTRGVKHGNFQVLRETPKLPSVLLELGFLSNWEEAEHTGKETSISSQAVLILETLVTFLYDD